MRFQSSWAMCFLSVALMANLWTSDSVRSDAFHTIATPFSSCVCEVDVQQKRMPVIILTKEWAECRADCPGLCPQFAHGATFAECLDVHTEDGTTGSQNPRHQGLRPNIVNPKVKQEETSMVPPKMVKHESYIVQNVYAACACEKSDLKFLAGDKDYYGGLQVWGRTGCSATTCGSACRPLGSNQSGCIIAAMTRATIMEDPTKGHLGYETLPISLNFGKH